MQAMCAICRDKNFHDVIDDDFFVRLDKDDDGKYWVKMSQ